MSLKKVLLVGANGTLGSVLLEGLVSSNSFDVSVARRESSKSTPAHAESISIVTIPDDFAIDALVSALKGQDVVIASFPLTNVVDQHLRLAEASAKAGVKRFIPADFGSCDAQSEQAKKLLKLYRDKDEVRNKAIELVKEYPDFSWTSIVCGHFFDYGIRDGLLHTDLTTNTAVILDKGDVPASASTLSRVAESLVAVLKHPDSTKNRLLYVQSFCKTQLEVVAALEKATGAEWKKEFVNSDEFLQEQTDKMAVKYDPHALEKIVFVLGALDAEWPKRGDAFAMKELGLEDEDLDEVIGGIVKQWRKEKESSRRSDGMGLVI
jgi:putative NADH-flavin reductase